MPINSFLYPGAKFVPPYSVANSCRFNADAYMVKDVVTPTNQKKYTISAWVKRSKISSRQRIFTVIDTSDTAAYSYLEFQSDDKLNFDDFDGSSTRLTRTTTNAFRDPSAWMNIIIAVDTTQSTGSNRVKMYINGTQVSSFGTETNASQNFDTTTLNSNKTFRVGEHGTAGFRFAGYMCEFVLIDGLQLDQTSFGEFDSDTPTVWKPIDVSDLTFGNNGFYLDFEDSSNLGNDANGGTDLTETSLAATDQSTDTCTNNFCTLNPLDGGNSGTFTEGNLKLVTANSGYATTRGTFGVSTGKWYFEGKLISGNAEIGIITSDQDINDSDDPLGKSANGYAYTNSGNKYNNDTNASYGNTYTDNDIISVALNLDDGELFFYKNGTIQNSGTAAYTSLSSNTYHPAVSDDSGSTACTWELNFGSAPFSISSGNSDANGHGNFEYSVPSGYFALCTKNLAESG
jgi:hypothetical protein